MIKNIWPKISLVTPSFNQAQFLEATIQSVLSQDYPNLEYFLIDGGSTDGSPNIIKKYQSHFSFWCSETDNGLYNAINKGFAHSSGEIMAWLNSDDLYFPWTLKTVANIMTSCPEIEWLTTLQRGQWDGQGFFIGTAPLPGYSKKAFLEGRYLPNGSHLAFGHIQQESTFWKRSLWEKAGMQLDRSFSLAGDFELWSRFYQYADLYGTPCPLGGFRYHREQQSSRREFEYIQEEYKALDTMRVRCHWIPNRLKSLLERNEWHRLPGMATMLKPWYSYTGKEVHRKDVRTQTPSWAVREYQFFLL